jgi:putative hydrolase of the HAD superfamily
MVLFFDIDGTLLDQSTAERAGALAIHRTFGAEAPVEEFVSRWSTALERQFVRYLTGELTYQGQGRSRVREVLDPTLTDEAADRIFDEYLAAYEAAWSLFPDVLSSLDQLSQYRLGVISNGQSHEQRRKLVNTGIEGRFEWIFVSEECGWAKPSREIFEHACVATGESPANVVYVGDSYDFDACAARRAGLTGVWLDRPGGAAAKHAPPVIGTLKELPRLLAERETQHPF